jgi:hypothetical protein
MGLLAMLIMPEIMPMGLPDAPALDIAPNALWKPPRPLTVPNAAPALAELPATPATVPAPAGPLAPFPPPADDPRET